MGMTRDLMRILTIPLLVAACATTGTTTTAVPKGGPRGLRVSEHLDLARQEDADASERSRWPETQMIVPGGEDRGDRVAVMPWYRSWNTSTEPEHLAAVHRSKAAELEAEVHDACGDRPVEEVSVSPLVRYGNGGWATANGAIVYLSPKAGTPDQLLAAMRCHRAFMMIAPSDMDDCPLDLPGLELDARGDTDGITVSLTVKDPALVPELKRRVAHDLEASQRTLSVSH